MRFFFAGFATLILHINCQAQSDCATLFSLPETFDARTCTDSTRYLPVFNDASPETYSFEISNKWGSKVFSTQIPEQGWNGRTNNRGEMNANGTYMWLMTFTFDGDSNEYACTGFVTCVNMEMKTSIAPKDTLACRPSFYVPNTFTPNGDGANDMFTPIFGCTPVEYEMVTFDRWGNLIFRTTDVRIGWSGDNVPTDVYVWQIKCLYYEGDKQRQYRGHVTLIR